MNYKLTVEEEAAIEHEVEMEREYLRMMGRSYTPIDLERILNKIRMRARNRIVDQRRKKSSKQPLFREHASETEIFYCESDSADV